ncbi:MAG: hypothetical protein IJ809_00025 [Clostridia bacterium]|nr:hypothetical protein [Clostridia bacterium]
MNFETTINKYIELLDCSLVDISTLSGISISVISKYRKGVRKPKANSKQFQNLINALLTIANNKHITLQKDELVNEFMQSLNAHYIDFGIFRDNFNFLVCSLKINLSSLALAMNYDSSYISKIKNGKRKPANNYKFVQDFTNYIAVHYKSDEDKEKVFNIIGIKASELKNNETYEDVIFNWLCTNKKKITENDAIDRFLQNIDDYDIDNFNDVVKKIKFTLPSTNILIPHSKDYYGFKNMSVAETEFIKSTLMSKSTNTLFLYNEMPMNEIVNDIALRKKWILGITMMLKKGIKLNIIHNINRPLNEMLLGLEMWIPLYMSGTISPYYFENDINELFMHMLCVSGSSALSGECLKSDINCCKLHYTTKKDEINYYSSKAKFMINSAKPLMYIYTNKNMEKFLELTKKVEKDFQKVKLEKYKNTEFYINSDKWISINKLNNEPICFVIYNSKLMNAIKDFIKNEKNK